MKLAKSTLDNLQKLSKTTKPTARIVDIPLGLLQPDPDQPRRDFSDDNLKDLAASLKAQGQIQPITVLPPDADGHHTIATGERRYRAALLADLPTVRAEIREDLKDPQKRQAAQLVENLQREDLSLWETAQSIHTLLGQGTTRYEVATMVGKDPTWVSRMRAIASSTTSAGTAVHEGWINSPEAFRRMGNLAKADQARLLEKARDSKTVIVARDLPAKKAPLTKEPPPSGATEKPFAEPSKDSAAPPAENKPPTAFLTETQVRLILLALDRTPGERPHSEAFSQLLADLEESAKK